MFSCGNCASYWRKSWLLHLCIDRVLLPSRCAYQMLLVFVCIRDSWSCGDSKRPDTCSGLVRSSWYPRQTDHLCLEGWCWVDPLIHAWGSAFVVFLRGKIVKCSIEQVSPIVAGLLGEIDSDGDGKAIPPILLKRLTFIRTRSTRRARLNFAARVYQSSTSASS